MYTNCCGNLKTFVAGLALDHANHLEFLVVYKTVQHQDHFPLSIDLLLSTTLIGWVY